MIVDDHPLVRDGLKQLVNREQDMEVCAEAADAEEALRVISEARPDVLLTDLSMKGMGGLRLIEEAVGRFPGMPILVLSFHAEKSQVERAIRAGASGYVTKDEASETVIQALRQVLDGSEFFSPSVVGFVRASPNDVREQLGCYCAEKLSDREIEVLEMLSQGLKTREIAENLTISRKTVEAHCENMKKKLGLTSIRELVTYAARRYGPECTE